MAPVGWSDLPRDLLTSIGNHLNNRIDILRFRSVCSSWRNSVPPFRKWQLRRFNLPNRQGFLSVTRITVFCLQPVHIPPNSPPPKAWLIRVSESDRRSKPLLLNLLSDWGMDPLSPLNLNLLELRVSEICRWYQVEYIDRAHYGVLPPIGQGWAGLGKVAFFSDTDLITGTTTTNDSVVVVLQDNRRIYGGNLATIRVGEDEFTPLSYSEENVYRDIVNFKGQIYAVDVFGSCYTVDSSLNLTLIVPLYDQFSTKKNLVVSSGELLMVDGFFRRTLASETDISCGYEMSILFRVYKMDEEEQIWVEVTNLGDRMLFVGEDGCFCVCAADFDVPSCRGNCIFFVDEDCMLFDENYHDQYNELRVSDEFEIGVFNLEDRSVGPLIHSPGYADLFWPRPSWLASTSSSSSNPRENSEDTADLLRLLKIVGEIFGSS